MTTAGVESGARTHTSAVTDNAASAGAAPSQNRGARDTGPATGGIQDQGVHRDGGQRDQPRYTSSDVDYEKKYAPDAYGKELSEDARVWSVYNDEAQIADEAMTKELNGTLDALLVFAGLFSAVVTTFVAQSSQALNPDYAQITASLVYELVLMQRAARTGTSGEVPASSLNLASRTSQTTDFWVNGLWLGSLMTALLAALVSVLAKQWIQYYNSLPGGSPRDRAHLRQFRLQGFQRWRVQEIIGFLPVLLAVALLLFFAGLVIYVAPMDAVIFWVTFWLSVAVFLAYALVTILPVFVPHCAYKTPLAHYMLVLHIAADLLRRQLVLLFAFFYGGPRFRSEILLAIDLLSWPWGSIATLRSLSLRHRERAAVESASDGLTGSVLQWLARLPGNVTAFKVALQATSALAVQSDIHRTNHLSLQAMSCFKSLYHDFTAASSSMLDNNHAAVAERLARSTLHRDSSYLLYVEQVWSLDVWEHLYNHRRRLDSAAIKALLCVVCWIRFCEDKHALDDPSALFRALDAFALLDTSLTGPKLHPVVWREIYYMANTCLLLCNDGYREDQRAFDLRSRMTTAERHAQYMPPDDIEDPYKDTAVTLDEYCWGCIWLGGRERFLNDLEKLKCALSGRLEKLK
ncbi:hypothetical protein K525DRAFT_197392, partial [Schizophyllum commune Loenen D]